MIKAFYFAAGSVFGAVLGFAFVYVIGHILAGIGIVMYATEADQQRNFNIVLLFSVVVALACGWLSVRHCAKSISRRH